MPSRPPFKLVVLLSGKGSNLEAIFKAIESGSLEAQVKLVLSDKQNAGGLEIARNHGVESHFLDPVDFESRQLYDEQLAKLIDKAAPDCVVLAGFMRILSPSFVSHFSGKLVNIHPSLLPAYKGLNTHQRALDAGEKWHGCSVHFVTEELDGGPVVAREQLPVDLSEDCDTLKQRVQALEHQLYPKVLGWIEKGLVKLENNTLFCDESLKTLRNISD